jgi:diguanylate cyclase (GGDEF)-like protein
MADVSPDFYKELFIQLETPAIVSDHMGQIKDINTAYASASGYSKLDVAGKNISIFVEGAFPFCDSAKKEVYMKVKNGGEKLQSLSVSTIADVNQDRPFYVWVLSDFQVTGFDPLTQLPNRFLLNQELKKALDCAKENRSILAVFYLDLDRFKFVNDTLGHSSGDVLLQEAARRVKFAIGENSMIARMGGDEFVCILEDLQDEKEAELIAKKIISGFNEVFHLYETEVYVSTSVGISLYPFDGDDEELLLTNADSAMYSAKKKGRNQFERAKANMAAGGFEKLLLENSLRKALDEDEFILYFQPQVHIKTSGITSMEALIRWNHPDLGIIAPGEFIPIAEETGLILPISDWVLKSVCKKMKEWQCAGYPPVRVAVNLSAGQFLQNGFVEKVKRILMETDLDPSFLELEITENMVMHDVKMAIAVLHKLQDLGVCIALDDFGTGYSSLNYLKDFPINSLKIDRSFIFDIDKNPSSAALTKAIAVLAHDLKLKVIAEGVENYKQLSMVKQLSCDTVQGFYFSKPLNDHDILLFLSKHDVEKVINA